MSRDLDSQFEAMIKFAATSYLLADLDLYKSLVSRKKIVRIEDFPDDRYPGKTPSLMNFCKELNDISLITKGEIDERLIIKWVARFIYLVLEGNRDKGIFSALQHSYSYDTIEKLVTENLRIFTEAFVPKDVSNQNYDRLEFCGDNFYNYYFCRYITERLSIQDVNVLTEMKHHYTDTKAFSELSRMIGLNNLIIGKSNDENIIEDVFESFVGAICLFEITVTRRYGFVPEERDIAIEYPDNELTLLANEFKAHAGIMFKFVSFVFGNFSVKTTDLKPSKTFVKELIRTFTPRELSDKLSKSKLTSSKEIQVLDRQFILRPKIPEETIKQIAETFGVDYRKLHFILSTTYIMDKDNVIELSTKTVSNIFYGIMTKNLIAIGVSKYEFVAHKNARIILKESKGDLQLVSQMASQKNFYIDIMKQREEDGISSASYSVIAIKAKPGYKARGTRVTGKLTTPQESAKLFAKIKLSLEIMDAAEKEYTD